MSKEASKKSGEPARKIFISHRHADKQIANVVRRQLQAWGIPEEHIFQSSSYKHAGKIGRPVKDQIKKFLEEAKLVILLYTSPHASWDYCMWECGLATDPGTIETNVIVFQCTEYTPRVFRDELLVRVDTEGIRRFTKQFHNEDGFFPGLGPFQPGLGEEGIDVRCAALLEALRPVLPTQERRDVVRWGYFTLSLPPKIVHRLNEAKSVVESHKVCFSIQDDLIVTDARGWGLRHFGYQDYEPGLTFKRIIDRWKSNVENLLGEEEPPADSVAWIKELNLEICRSLRNDPPQLTWTPMKSVYPHIDWWVCPVVNQARYLSNGSVELDVYMYRVPSPGSREASHKSAVPSTPGSNES